MYTCILSKCYVKPTSGKGYLSWRRNCRTFTYTYYVTLLVCCTYAVHVIRIRFDCGINTRCLASRPVLNPPLFRQPLVEPRRTTILPTHVWCCDRYVGYIVIPRYTTVQNNVRYDNIINAEENFKNICVNVSMFVFDHVCLSQLHTTLDVVKKLVTCTCTSYRPCVRS